MNVLFLSPGYPVEMAGFVRGLAEVGADVIGVGDQDESALPDEARSNLAAYFRVDGFADEDAVVETGRGIASRVRIDRVESLWEPLLILAARIRAHVGAAGLGVSDTIPFRDKEEMKRVLDAAGIRTPHHYRARSVAEARAAAERTGFPAILKPIAGAGSLDTYRVEDVTQLEVVFPQLLHVPEVSVEEFVEAEEFTFDTVCAGGRPLFYSMLWYRPRPLVGKQLEWISQQAVVLRNPDVEYLDAGRRMGVAVLEAMRFDHGFTHMEWYRRPDGEAVFGEIAARPAGARVVDLMNYACDIDLYRGWAEAVCHGTFTQPVERRYNCAAIFKRAQGQGRIQRIEGLGPLLAEYGEHVVLVELASIGSPRRDWRQSVVGDGMVVVRHPDLQETLEMADRFGTELQLYAG